MVSSFPNLLNIFILNEVKFNSHYSDDHVMFILHSVLNYLD